MADQVRYPLRVYMGDSGALILSGYLARHTEDIDLVNEVPVEIRSLRELLEKLKEKYGLYLAHFQSHYLPSGWMQRVHSLEPFGKLQAFLVDVYDIFLSKLFSIREKDKDDLRELASQLDKETMAQRLKDTTTDMLAAAELRKRAEQNWYILYGEPLPQ